MKIKDLSRIEFYKKNWFTIAVLLILLLAAILRFYNYPNRWALAGDQARDAIIAKYAFENHLIPAVGPFSSAGNFTTGNIWYIWLIISYAIFPYAMITPWVILGLTYILIVYLMILIGKELIDKKFGLLLGFFAAISNTQIQQSLNLTNPSLVALFSTLVVLFVIKYIKTQKNIYLFLFPLFISLTIMTHFQAVYLLILVPLALIFKRPKLKSFIYPVIGLVIPVIPYLWFDITHNLYNYRGITDYLQYGQYKIYIPNRWLTYAGTFWPDLWGNIVGGDKIMGYITIFLFAGSILASFIRKKLSRELIFLIISFVIMFVALRYYRGERYFGYFIFLHPFILIFSGFAYYFILKTHKLIGIFLIFLILFITLQTEYPSMMQKEGKAQIRTTEWVKNFSKELPAGKKFDLYTYTRTPESASLPLALYLYRDNKIENKGYKIGFGSTRAKDKLHFKFLKDTNRGSVIWDLNTSSSAQLKQSGWRSINPSAVYKTSAAWYE